MLCLHESLRVNDGAVTKFPSRQGNEVARDQHFLELGPCVGEGKVVFLCGGGRGRAWLRFGHRWRFQYKVTKKIVLNIINFFMQFLNQYNSNSTTVLSILVLYASITKAKNVSKYK